MAPARLAVIVLLLGTVLLLIVQNTAPALPLVFLGVQTLTLPVGIWLGLAIGLGALTTIGLAVLLDVKSGGRSKSRSQAYKYRPQSFYEPASSPATPGGGGRATAAGATPGPTDQGTAPDYGTSAAQGDWQEWTNLQSRNQWSDWESVGRTPNPADRQGAPQAASSPSSSPSNSPSNSWWPTWFGNRQNLEEEQVKRSLEDLESDWGDMDNRRYTAPGVSPVDDSLEDITEGWDDWSPDRQEATPRDYEAPQTPKRVYRDGSIYSYSYREGDNSGQTDRIYDPADDLPDSPNAEAQGYPPEPYPAVPDPYYSASDTLPDDSDLEAPEMAEDGVVDADYRVIIPPYPSPTPDPDPPTWTGDEDGWDEADDALTP
jgi:hypothetical protein